MLASRPLPLAVLAVALSCGGAAAGDNSGVYDFIYREKPRPFGINPFGFGRPQSNPWDEPLAPRIHSSATRTYCVRTCDGYYFAIGFPRTEHETSQHETMCTASCGGMEMRLYSSPVQSDDGSASAIDRATDDTGALYTALPAAHAFKTKTASPTCSCQGTTGGLPQIPILADPTLRYGDIVVMADGLKIFRGSPGPLHQDADFVSVAGARDLSNAVRKYMLSLEGRIAEQP